MVERLAMKARHCRTRTTIRIMNMITRMRVTDAPMKAAAVVSNMSIDCRVPVKERHSGMSTRYTLW